MINLAELPIVGGLFHAVITYVSQTARILRRPFRFARQTSFSSGDELKRSTEYCLAAIVVSYVIHIPLFMRYDADVSQAFFLIFRYVTMFIVSLCIHASLRLFGSRKPLRTTVVAQSYVNGFFMPVGQLLALPFTLAIGPSILFRGLDAAADPVLAGRVESAYGDPIVQLSLIAFSLLNLWGTVITVSWYAYAHEMKGLRVFGASLVGILFAFAVLQFLFLPLWDLVKDALEGILQFM